ncbi:DUF4222 domain-containing protein [Citrobacter youngae]|uniref:DUF4222 domain-containing protein n=1 Tax=Citrobacter pasteurii TaxID=1563222 RepID=A0A6N6K6P8_9ENTR|nr:MULTISPECIES: DUF4222 domain-containing protein [Citrobacter]KAA1278124.1 DUF4222 domain-containing protein [Citrobacter pasteurii]MDL4457724.1 DUF4222 domain-containing protein [Citrobacter youngae]MDM2940349.1 DUF4222 domain-containing protein [Citrobacter sp. Cy082]PXH04851.1 hypothetical protein DMR07_05265 [Citrobacter freundii]HEE0082046.1 DUF4222 domain-containing protein [Citrobacter youngae]
MKKKINSLTAGGSARSEIELNSRWKDSYGEKITVTGTTESSITYVRDGYSRECVCSEYRFRNDFIFLPEETEKNQTVVREIGLKKIAALRSSLPLSVGSDGWDKGLK